MIKILLVIIAASLVGINVQMFRNGAKATTKPVVESQIVEVLGNCDVPNPYSGATKDQYLVRESTGKVRMVRLGYPLAHDTKFLIESAGGSFMPILIANQNGI